MAAGPGWLIALRVPNLIKHACVAARIGEGKAPGEGNSHSIAKTSNAARLRTFNSEQLDAEQFASCPDPAVERCNRHAESARQFEINDVVSLQVITQAEINDFRRV